MRVLVLGANGFIGSAVVAALLQTGHEVRAAVRKPEKLIRRFPGIQAVQVDLCDIGAHDPAFWNKFIDQIDAVVNVAGILQTRDERDAWAVHLHAPLALFAACERAGLRRVFQISAIGVDEAETVYARSKRAGDEALKARDLDWTILRPAIVFGDGSYGGTSMLRAIAASPWVLPLIGDGRTPLEFIHKEDLAAAIIELLKTGAARQATLMPANNERLTLHEALRAYRRWLGLPDVPSISIPLPIVGWLARLGDLVRLDPINSTAIAQFETRLTGDAETFAAESGIQARSLTTALRDRPAESQDLWHARLFMLRPVIRLALALLWLISGVLGWFADPVSYAHLLAPITDDPSIVQTLGRAMSLVDLAIAGCLVAGWRLKQLAIIQLALVLGYTFGLTLLAPSLWGDLVGGLLKNIPILALLCVHRVLEEER